MDSVKKVVQNTPVKLDNGRLLFSQAHPKLRYRPKEPLSTLTPGDIEQRIRHNLRIIRIIRGQDW